MRDRPDRKYFTESLKVTRSSAVLSELIADDMDLATAPMSGS
jgi:hypothetical protein